MNGFELGMIEASIKDLQLVIGRDPLAWRKQA